MSVPFTILPAIDPMTRECRYCGRDYSTDTYTKFAPLTVEELTNPVTCISDDCAGNDTWYELWEYDKKHRRGPYGEYLGTYPDTFFSVAAAIKERKEIAGAPALRSRWRIVKRTPQGYFDIDGTQLTGSDWTEIAGGVPKQ